ncbi:glycoside hydrolase family 32 protein [Glutamicibacter sp. PS]|uniref:glycoside hydrolase family 32 protein n=1 Tax=Glutamicibacter sp. PS TaxID=3075634 RepID=UPI00284C9D24|nr:glycoside hydrolase family 32 protein [Glutamicibacter sp. PS]MDR4534169.1 glycoside hydrolase family 32 protein [Glutamicibacter sp. PS]
MPQNTSKPSLVRRTFLIGAGGLAATFSGLLPAAAAPGRSGERPRPERPGHPTAQPAPEDSYRPAYHFSVPDNWKNDPQRPVYIDGEYLYYYLYNDDYLAGGHGTSWRLATTKDHVSFIDRGVAIEKFSNPNGDCWSGCVVLDREGTAGYGTGALIALVTQAPQGTQGQYLWYSTDKGRSYSPGPDYPVLPNPGVHDFRDPKVIWDEERGRWFMANAEGKRLAFYTSPNLRDWSYVADFPREELGVLECPDLFKMRAEDGTEHWVLGVSANGKSQGLPATYAYWTGRFDGISFTADNADPEWLDRGFDFYGAVTFEGHDAAGQPDPALRHAIGWANFWDYPHNAPSLVTDHYNGDDMIVRDLHLLKEGGRYVLTSQPAAALRQYTIQEHVLGDVVLSGTQNLAVHSRAYELSCTLTWDTAAPPGNIGFELCRAPGGGRHVAAGAYFDGGFSYVNRRPTFNPGAGGESQVAFDTAAGELEVRILVDHSSVEFFVGNGRVVHSHRAFPLAGDDGIRLFVSDGQAVYRNLTIRELAVP